MGFAHDRLWPPVQALGPTWRCCWRTLARRAR